MAQPGDKPDEKEIDAKIAEIEKSIEELKQKKQALLGEKRSLHPGAISLEGLRIPPRFKKTTLTPLEKTLNSLEWKGFKKKDGEWTFLRSRDGKITEGLETATEFVDEVRKGKEVVVGRYRYRASEDRFLNRFSADAVD